MSALTALARRGVPVDFESMLGTMRGGAPTKARWRVGLALQMVNGGLLVQPPACGWAAGARLGVLHSLAAGGVLGAVPLLVTTHVLYGAIVGTVHAALPRRAGRR